MSGDKNPMQRAQELARPHLPKRFYKDVAVAQADAGWTVTLDGRHLKTPGRKPLDVPIEAVARMIAAEWDAQVGEVNPATMPVTRLANTAIDGVATVRAEVARDVADFACSDLVCYRAEEPDELVALQAQHWDPLVAWFSGAHGMDLRLATGVVAVGQNETAAQALGDRLGGRAALELAALHTLTSLAGSAVIALAVADGHLPAATGWQAAHVDEDWQISQWGEDHEAKVRRSLRWEEFEAAARVLAAHREAGIGG